MCESESASRDRRRDRDFVNTQLEEIEFGLCIAMKERKKELGSKCVCVDRLFSYGCVQ